MCVKGGFCWLGDLLNSNGFCQQLFCLYQLISFFQNVPKVVHSMDVGRVQPKQSRKSCLRPHSVYCHDSTSEKLTLHWTYLTASL